MTVHSPCRSQRATEVLQDITMRIESNSIVRQCFAGRNTDGLSFWGLFFAYHICSVSLSSEKLTLKPEIMRTLKDGFVKIDARWNLAGIVKTSICSFVSTYSFFNYRCLFATSRGSHSYQQAGLSRNRNQSIYKCCSVRG